MIEIQSSFHLSLDPGLRGIGMALWCADALLDARYIASKAPRSERNLGALLSSLAESVRAEIPPVRAVTLECPQVYRAGLQKGDPNDLIAISLVAGLVSGIVGAQEIKTLAPREWKGQVPKEIMQKRIVARLSEEELACVALPSAKGLAHNVWDAVGIGLSGLGRL